jgi:DNA excision repair protein ERCC-4
MYHNNSGKITILADDREQKGEVITFLQNMENVDVKIQRLSLGDYLTDRLPPRPGTSAKHNRLVFERKTLRDFALSIIDGRLFKQATRLAASDDESILILEGTGKELSETGLKREAMQGALISISLILGIPVLRSINPCETAHLIIYATRQINSIATGAVRRAGYRPKGKRKRQLFILQGLPGVGREKAKRLLDKFGSLEGVINASTNDLQSINGIGKSTADEIKWVVKERIAAYRVDI